MVIYGVSRLALIYCWLCVVWDSVSYTITMLMKSIHITRLETRAKEFHYCASTRVCQTLMRNESEGALGALRWEACHRALHHRPIRIL